MMTWQSVSASHQDNLLGLNLIRYARVPGGWFIARCDEFKFFYQDPAYEWDGAVKWELVKSDDRRSPIFWRTSVPGGWFIETSGAVHLHFYPDPMHEWDVNSLQPEAPTAQPVEHEPHGCTV